MIPKVPALILMAGLMLAAGSLAWLALSSVDRAVRVRNAFLLRRGREEDFRWTPATLPLGFRVETADPPEEIGRALVDTGVTATNGDWARARAIVTMLVANWQRPGAIRADLATTFRRILDGSGYCADYVRVFLAAARGAGLFCRQWSFSFDGFGGHGHTFVEVFDRERGAWAFLDVHNNVYATLAGSLTPLSALDLRRAIMQVPADVEFPPAGPGRLGFRHPDKLLDYYRRGAAEWYLWWGNDVITRDATILPRGITRWVGPLLHRLHGAIWRLPPFVALVTPENDARVAQMERLRHRVIAAVVAIGVLGVLLIAPHLSAALGSAGNA
ncbi:MAG TPA: transglutaminase domain-containing protein [Casimicrobiaceae bacterium]